jgi:hypothetical protein
LIGGFQQLVRPRHGDGSSRLQAPDETAPKGGRPSGVRLNARAGEPMKTRLGA